MAETVQLAGDFDWQDGGSSVTGTLYFTLNKRDFDGSVIIEPREQEVPLNSEGEFTGVELWPNDRGRSGSRYKVEFLPSSSNRRVEISKGMLVPELGGPHQLGDLLELTDMLPASRPAIAGFTTLTQEQFDTRQAAGQLVDGLYLVEVA